MLEHLPDVARSSWRRAASGGVSCKWLLPMASSTQFERLEVFAACLEEVVEQDAGADLFLKALIEVDSGWKLMSRREVGGLEQVDLRTGIRLVLDVLPIEDRRDAFEAACGRRLRRSSRSEAHA